MEAREVTQTHRFVQEAHFRNLLSWSVDALLSENLRYKDSFQLKSIRSLLIRNRTKEIIEDDKMYKQVTVRLYGKGVVQRGETLVSGKSIGTKNQYRVSEGQFIMSKIDARNGAFGIVPQELDGAITTQDFLSYTINTSEIVPQFFVLITSSEHFYALCQRASSGTTGRQRVDEKAFLSFKIPLPDKAEQQRLVDEYLFKLRQVESKRTQAETSQINIEETLQKELGLPESVSKEKQRIFQLHSFKDITFWGVDKILGIENYTSAKYKTTSFELSPHLYIEAFRGKSPKYDPNGKHKILNQKCNRWNYIEIEHAKPVNDQWFSSISKNILTQEGDILVNSTGEGTIGRASYVSADFTNLLIDSHVLLLRVDHDYVIPEFIVFLINSEYGQNQIDFLKSAKSTKQTELGVQNLLRIMFPIPTLAIQKKLAREIRASQNRIEELKSTSDAEFRHAQQEFEAAIFNVD